VFYVTDLMGAKISMPTRQAAIKRALLPLLTAAEAAPARRASLSQVRSIPPGARPSHFIPPVQPPPMPAVSRPALPNMGESTPGFFR